MDLKSSINLIDNFSATMSKFVRGSSRVMESTERMQKQMDFDTGVSENLLRQGKLVEALGDKYDAQSQGISVMRQNLDAAIAKEQEFSEALEQAGSALDKLYEQMSVETGFGDHLKRQEELVEALSSGYGDQQKEIQRVSAALAEERRVLVDKREQITALQQALDGAKAKEEAFAGAIEQATGVLDTMREHMYLDAGANEQIQRQEELIESLSNRYEKQRNEVQRLSDAYDLGKKAVKDISREVGVATQQLDAAIGREKEFAQAVEQARNVLGQMQAQPHLDDGAQEQLQQQMQLVEALTGKYGQQYQEIQKIANALAHASIELSDMPIDSSLAEQIQQQEELVESLGAKYIEQRREVRRLQEAYEDEQKALAGRVSQVEVAKQNLETATAKEQEFVRSVEQANHALSTPIDNTAYDSSLEARIQRQEQLLDRLVSQYSEKQQRLQEISRQIEFGQQLGKTMSGSTGHLDKLIIEYQEAEAELLKFATTIDRASDSLDRMRSEAERQVFSVGAVSEESGKAARMQERMNQSMRDGTLASSSLVGNLKRLVGAYLGFRGLKMGFEATIGAAAQLDQQVVMMQAAFGNADIGEVYFDRLQQYAARTGQEMEELSRTTRNFMQLTRNTDKLMGLTEIATRLSLRTEGIGSAEVLMQEAMRGQYTRLQRTLHLTDSQLAPLKEAVQAGSLEGIIGAFDEALNTAGLTKEIVEAFQASPLQKFNAILAEFKKKLAGAGEKALERLTPLLERVDAWLQSDSATRFFNTIAYGVSQLANGIMFVVDLIQNNWPTVKTILLIAGAMIMTQIVASLWAVIPPLIAQMAPLLIIIGIVYLIAKAYVELGGTIEAVTEFIGGLFGALYADIYNQFAGIYNLIATVAEFLANVWHNPIFAVKQLFVGLLDFILSTLQRVASAMDFVFRTNMSDTIQDWRDNLQKEIEEMPEGYKVLERMQEISFEDTVNKGRDIGRILPGKIQDGLDSVTQAINNLTDLEANLADMEAKWNAQQIDTLGSIDDNTRQMTDEDLKWLRDAAEQEAINRYTTNNLAPQILIEFGDVKETADVDGIVDRLENILTELMNTTAEGVHA